MSRMRVDTQPSIIIWPHLAEAATPAEAEGVAKAVAEVVRVEVAPQLWQVPGLSRLTAPPCDIETRLEDDFRCAHCSSVWTGTSADFNGGCCGRDEANDPERLASVRQAANDVKGVAFYAIDNSGQRSGAPVSWPNTLARVAISWLDAGRPDGWASVLLFGIRRVRDREWRSLRIDPSLRDAALVSLLEGVRDRRPDNLGCALLELMDDMGLLTASARTRGAR